MEALDLPDPASLRPWISRLVEGFPHCKILLPQNLSEGRTGIAKKRVPEAMCPSIDPLRTTLGPRDQNPEVAVRHSHPKAPVKDFIAEARYEVQKRNRPRESEVIPLTFTTRGSVLVLAGAGSGADQGETIGALSGARQQREFC